MAKNPPGERTSNPFPKGIPSRLVAHRKAKTKAAVDAEVTKVTRRERE